MAQVSLDLRCLQLSAALSRLFPAVSVDDPVPSALQIAILSDCDRLVPDVCVDLSTRSEKLLFCFGESDLFRGAPSMYGKPMNFPLAGEYSLLSYAELGVVKPPASEAGDLVLPRS